MNLFTTVEAVRFRVQFYEFLVRHCVNKFFVWTFGKQQIGRCSINSDQLKVCCIESQLYKG